MSKQLTDDAVALPLLAEGFVYDPETEMLTDCRKNSAKCLEVGRGWFQVRAFATNLLTNQKGKLVEWDDESKCRHSENIESAALLNDQQAVIGRLIVGSGYRISSKAAMTSLTDLILSAEPADEVLIAPTCGWHAHGEEAFFVLPESDLKTQSGKTIEFHGSDDWTHKLAVRGSHVGWLKGAASTSMPIPIFGVCLSLSAPYQNQVGAESGGFHIYGSSSGGKTTVGCLVASVWGSGSDPMTSSQKSLVTRWDGTAIGIQELIAEYSDLPCVLDEIGVIANSDPTALKNLIYQMSTGTTRHRAKKDGSGRQQQKQFRTTIFSTGEISTREVAERGNYTLDDGMLTRLVNVAIEGTPVEDKERSELLKATARDHCGHAGRLMREKLEKIDTEDYNAFSIDSLELPSDADHKARRARDRLKLPLYIGLKAAELGIIPWSKEQVIEAMQQVWQWCEIRTHEQDSIRQAEDALRDGINRYRAHFKVRNADHQPLDCYGLVDSSYYFINSDALANVILKGHDHKRLWKHLKKVGHVTTDSPSGGKSRLTKKVSGANYYAVCKGFIHSSETEFPAIPEIPAGTAKKKQSEDSES